MVRIEQWDKLIDFLHSLVASWCRRSGCIVLTWSTCWATSLMQLWWYKPGKIFLRRLLTLMARVKQIEVPKRAPVLLKSSFTEK